MWVGRWVVLGLFLFCHGGFANPHFPLFEKHFREQYEPRYCGKNALRFVEGLKAAGEDLQRFHIVTIENKGFSVFGMLNAERARGTRFNRPAEEERNWYHHVFVLDDQGLVYDFDFTIEPRIAPIAEYLEEMFLKEGDEGQTFKVGRKTKLADYALTAVPALAAVDKSAVPKKSHSLDKVVKDWRVLIFHEPALECHLMLFNWKSDLESLFH